MNTSNFVFTKYEDENTFFIAPSKNYVEKFGFDFIDQVNTVSYGAKNKFAVCRFQIYNKCILLEHFDNYVRNYYISKHKKFTNKKYKGLGKVLLKNSLIFLLNENQITRNSKISLFMVNTKNKKLVEFYKNLSFILYHENDFSSSVGKVLNALEEYPILEFEHSM